MLTVAERDLRLPDGRVLHGYDTGPTGRADELAVFWHGGTPNTGLPPAPLFAAAERLGVRFLGADRPGYGGSSRVPDQRIADVAGDVAAVADAAGVRRLVTIGHSGGGPRALAAAALLPDRIVAAAAMASPAPPDAEGLRRDRGMAPVIAREQAAAAAGRGALATLLAAGEWDETVFTPEDLAALDGEWSWFGPVVTAATADGPDAQIDDLLAAAAPWGFAPEAIAAPVLVLHGTADRVVPVAHGEWLARRVPGARWRPVEGAGHLTVLDAAADALARLRAAA